MATTGREWDATPYPFQAVTDSCTNPTFFGAFERVACICARFDINRWRVRLAQWALVVSGRIGKVPENPAVCDSQPLLTAQINVKTLAVTA